MDLLQSVAVGKLIRKGISIQAGTKKKVKASMPLPMPEVTQSPSQNQMKAGGPGSGRKPSELAESASTKEEHLAAVKFHNEQAQVLMQYKGQDAADAAFAHGQASQSHADAARLGTARHSGWAQRASGNANAMSERLRISAEKVKPTKDTPAKEGLPQPTGRTPTGGFNKIHQNLTKQGYNHTSSSEVKNEGSSVERHTYEHPTEGMVTLTHNKITEVGKQQQKVKKAKETKEKNAGKTANVNVNVNVKKNEMKSQAILSNAIACSALLK